MPPSTLNPATELLLAYDEANLLAALHYQALRTQQYPTCLCQSGARNEFKRRYRKLLAASSTTTTSPAAAQPPHPLRFWRTVLVCFVVVVPTWWALITGLRVLMQGCG